MPAHWPLDAKSAQNVAVRVENPFNPGKQSRLAQIVQAGLLDLFAAAAFLLTIIVRLKRHKME